MSDEQNITTANTPRVEEVAATDVKQETVASDTPVTTDQAVGSTLDKPVADESKNDEASATENAEDSTAAQQFKRIDATTLAMLIDGEFKEKIRSFTIIDCRYPYEYEGGHIVNSLNVHTPTELIKLFIDEHRSPTIGDIIIFHCEFSSERGPKLMRLLREKDRQINTYPKLLYPELYLLDGGYREFYKTHKEYCVPQSYKPMKAKNHRDELKNYRKRRKAAHPRRKENRTPDISFDGS